MGGRFEQLETILNTLIIGKKGRRHGTDERLLLRNDEDGYYYRLFDSLVK